jgi:hypothetical protein
VEGTLVSRETPVDARQRSLGDGAEVLALARRIDWRFLLPSPELGRVAYLGREDTVLIAALMRFADAALVVGNDGPDGDGAKFDLAVLSRPTGDECETTRRLLRPGGTLYAEIHGPLAERPRRPGSLRSVVSVVRVLRDLGFAELGAHWHWPNFAASTHVVPLDSREALGYVLERRWAGSVRVMSVIGAVAGKSLLNRWAPYASIVAVAPR